MEINDKKLTRTRKIISFAISCLLAWFLILLASTIINDLSGTAVRPTLDKSFDQQERSQLVEEKKSLSQQISQLQGVRSNYAKMSEQAISNKKAEQDSFDNWIKTRGTLGNPEQDRDVILRVKKLDDYQIVVQSWQQKVDQVDTQIDALNAKIDDSNQLLANLQEQAYKQYQHEMNRYDFRIFITRLLFVAPILIVGIFFFIRFRQHKFAPLFMGFSLFSLYAFFVGLVPYLPSYGGYIRYSVGVLLTLGLGYYAIKTLKEYTERKKKELSESIIERASKLQPDVAEKAFNNHICPSCGKDFLLKAWENTPDVPHAAQSKNIERASHYCRFCGFQLLKTCTVCQQQNYAHLPFCLSCGDKLAGQKE